MDNQIIALPKKVLFAEKSFEGFKPFCYERYWDIIKKNQTAYDHEKIENDDELIQPMTVICVYRPGQNSLFYFKNQTETKKENWSIAITGHIKKIPKIEHPLQEIGLTFFKEKFKNRRDYSVKPIGYLYSSKSEQTKNHFGLLFLVNIDVNLQVCCPNLFISNTENKNRIHAFINSSFPFDHWTRIVYEAVRKHINHF